MHLAVQWCPLSQKSQLKKGEQVFLKRLQLLLLTGLSAETKLSYYFFETIQCSLFSY